MTDGTAWGRHRPLCMYSFLGRGGQGERDCGVAVDVCENMCCIWEGIIGNAWRMLENIEKV